MAALKLCNACGKAFQPDPRRRRNTRCPTCQAPVDQRDNQRRNQHPRQRVYRDPRWQRTRRVVLQRDDYQCQVCGVTGDVVDHIDGITMILQRGGDVFYPDECQTLCAHHSGVKDGARATR